MQRHFTIFSPRLPARLARTFRIEGAALAMAAAVALQSSAAHAAVTTTSNGQELSGVTTITGTLVPPSAFTLSQGSGNWDLATNELAAGGITLTKRFDTQNGDATQQDALLNINGGSWRYYFNGGDSDYGYLTNILVGGGISGSIFGQSTKNMDYAIRPFAEGSYLGSTKAGIKFMAHSLGYVYNETVKNAPYYIFYGHITSSMANTVGATLDPAQRLDNMDNNLEPMMELGGDSHLLKLIHVTDNTKSIVMNPTAGSITIHGQAVLTTADAASFAQQSALSALQTTITTSYVAKSADTLAIGQYATAGGYGMAIGQYAAAASRGFAIGVLAKAGEGAISFGTQAGIRDEVAASGASSISLGNQASGEGIRSIALGTSSWAGGASSIAAGLDAMAYTDNSVAIGRHVVASKWGQVILGAFNEPTDNTVSNTPDEQDAIFVIGNGTSDTGRSNALLVKRNGDAQVTGAVNVAKNASISQNLSVTGTTTLEGQVTAEADINVQGNMHVQGILHVEPGGDISMGEFTASPSSAPPP